LDANNARKETGKTEKPLLHSKVCRTCRFLSDETEEEKPKDKTLCSQLGYMVFAAGFPL
jgi:hypothetical protein